MRLQEEFVSYVVGRTLNKRKEEQNELERDTTHLERVTPPFHRILYTDAIKKFNELGSTIPWGSDLGAEEETLLATAFDRPVFVMTYPQEVKAFYMKRNPADPRTVLNN